MAAYGPATVRTGPLAGLVFQQRLNPQFLDIFEIFDHAHVIFLAVTRIEFLETLAGELYTLKAVFHPPLPYQLTTLDKDTIQPPGAAPRTVFFLDPMLFGIVFLCEVVTA